MTKVGLALALSVAACAVPRDEPPAPPGPPWGDEAHGLRCRVRAPSMAAQGDLVRTSVEVGAVRLQEGGVEFDPDLRARRTSLELVGQSGRVVVVRTYDPYQGMPPDPEEIPCRLRDPREPLTESIEFPLATAWDDLPPGDYRCRVRLSYEPGQDMYFRGTLVSPEFPLRVDAMPPREETFLLPKALHVVETTEDDGTGKRIPVRRVVYRRADAEEVRLPRRNGFFLGTDLLCELNLARFSGTVEPGAVNPIDATYGTFTNAQKLGDVYTIVIFETADAPEHMWHPGPGSGGYRELWRRTLPVTPGAASAVSTGTIVVRVVAADGAPLANARIVLQRLEPPFTGHRPATTGADGVARFDALGRGRYRVGLKAAPGVPESWMNTSSEDWRTAAGVDVTEGRVAEVALAAPRFVAFEVSADAADFVEGVHPRIDVVHLYPGGSWCHAGRQTSWKPERRDGSILWRITDAPEGRYEVRLYAKGRASSTTEVAVRSSDVPLTIRVKPGPVVAPIELVYDGPPLTADHYFTLSSADRSQHDVVNGTFSGTPPSAVVTEARPGRYVLTLWRSGCATLLDVPEGGDRRLGVSVPSWGGVGVGSAEVTVVVTKGGAPIRRMMVAIAPASDEPLASGKWFRCTDAGGTFAGVPPGDWDVFAFDGVYGQWFGFDTSPLVRRIRVGAGPVTVTLDR